MELARLLLGVLVAGFLPRSVRFMQNQLLAAHAFSIVYAGYAILPVLQGWKAYVLWAVVAVVPVLQRTPPDLRERGANIVGWLGQVRHRRAVSPTLWPPDNFRSNSMLLAIILPSSLIVFYGATIPDVVGHLFDDDRLSVVLSGFLLAVFVGNLVVARVVQPYFKALPKEDQEVGLLHLGTRLGWIERALVFIFIAAGQPEAAALAITAKSLVRIPEIRDHGGPGFGQYVIVGTLTSLLVAVGVGIVVRIAFGLPAL